MEEDSKWPTTLTTTATAPNWECWDIEDHIWMHRLKKRSTDKLLQVKSSYPNLYKTPIKFNLLVKSRLKLIFKHKKLTSIPYILVLKLKIPGSSIRTTFWFQFGEIKTTLSKEDQALKMKKKSVKWANYTNISAKSSKKSRNWKLLTMTICKDWTIIYRTLPPSSTISITPIMITSLSKSNLTLKTSILKVILKLFWKIFPVKLNLHQKLQLL